jgi:hypothetical protein
VVQILHLSPEFKRRAMMGPREIGACTFTFIAASSSPPFSSSPARRTAYSLDFWMVTCGAFLASGQVNMAAAVNDPSGASGLDGGRSAINIML